MKVMSYASGEWFDAKGAGRPVLHAVTGEPVAEISTEGLDFQGMIDHAHRVGGPNLRRMTFHARGRMLKALAQALMARKKELYELSTKSGATKGDAWVDVDGGIGTFFIYASKGRRELPDEPFLLEGNMERTSREGTFVGHHVKVPRRGVAVHINSFNFPVWGMLEKLAPTFLGGMPAIVKPASATAYVTEHAVRIMIESGLLPEGALQLISGSVGDLLDRLDEQDVVTFTGSAATGLKIRSNANLLEKCVPFNMEADSLNFALLGPDAEPGTPEFDLFVREVVNEMRIKTGQRCTAVRRALIPRERMDAVIEAMKKRFAKYKVGDPTLEDVKMGPLVSLDQRKEVQAMVEKLKSAARLVHGDGDFEVVGADREKGAFHPFTLLLCDEPLKHAEPHDIEAFGPVSTLMPYDDAEQAAEVIRRGRGSLVGTVVTADDGFAKTMVLETAAYHGRLHILNRHCAGESTGHGSPLPHLVHGGPGRAGGGEEMGGVRALDFYMQRCAIQGSPTTLSRIGNRWLPGADRPEAEVHPFKKYFEDLEIGETLTTHRRTVTETDIVNFAGVSGDYFYAHMDDIAVKDSIFERRVAHGYFVLSAAAGLFVHPGHGPVLANYGLENLRFIEPVYPGDTIHAKLTVQEKTEKEPKEDEQLQGVVEWHVDVINQEDVVVATYGILTLVARRGS
jgi:oxepin-CoA hydrolase/3-oxo-5,6-dehydrosuberyl-CoA semialdehyde dehydrogenase